MLFNWDAAVKAWNALEWNFTFSIGDGITLLAALATTVIAFLTYQIQKEQKKIVEQQNKIIERQVIIDENMYERENDKLRLTIMDHISLIVLSYEKGVEPKQKWFNVLLTHTKIIRLLFNSDVNCLVNDLYKFRVQKKDQDIDSKTCGIDFKNIREKYQVVLSDFLEFNEN